MDEWKTITSPPKIRNNKRKPMKPVKPVKPNTTAISLYLTTSSTLFPTNNASKFVNNEETFLSTSHIEPFLLGLLIALFILIIVILILGVLSSIRFRKISVCLSSPRLAVIGFH